MKSLFFQDVNQFYCNWNPPHVGLKVQLNPPHVGLRHRCSEFHSMLGPFWDPLVESTPCWGQGLVEPTTSLAQPRQRNPLENNS
jgi:hypothetical protein